MAVTQLPGLDLSRLGEHLERVRPDLLDGMLEASVITGGKSNMTYAVTDGAHHWVLRRPPLGHVLATAHDMGREARVIGALAGSAVPVPEVILTCDDTEVLGAPFYLMEHVAGVALRTTDELTDLGPERVRRISARVVRTLTDLHAIDPASVGLDDFGRPEGYVTRQVSRWKRQLDASRSREVAGIEELHDWLETHIPQSPAPTILHGDYRLDNVLIDTEDGDRLSAVLDWEMATLGDPLTDVALLWLYATLGSSKDGKPGDDPEVEGLLTADEMCALYAELTGRGISSMGFYNALAAFKLAVIMEGIHYRFTQGKTVGEEFATVGEGVERVVALGLSSLHETTPRK